MTRADFLSDLGQWMLKVLLSHRLPAELRVRASGTEGRVDEPVVHALALAGIAGVSVASAARIVGALRHEGFLAEDGVLRLRRTDELLERWRAVFMRPRPEVHARWLFPSKDPAKQLDTLLRGLQQQRGRRAALGLFAACDRLGYRLVTGVAPHLLLEKVSPAAVQPLGLRLAELGEGAAVIVREPRFAEAVFRGVVNRDGVPVTDVLQCWLDVRDHPARGEEMAAHLFERVIRPRLVEDDR